MSDLFPDLPIQHPPRVIMTDRHALETCEPCGGTGSLETGFYVIDRAGRLAEPPEMRQCRRCLGRGIVLREIELSSNT